MRPSSRLIPALILSVAVSLSLSACGDKDTDSGAAMKGESASKAADLTKDNFSKSMLAAIEKAGSSKVHFNAGQPGKEVSGDGEVSYGDPLAVRMKMPAPTGSEPQEMLMIGDTMYIGMNGKYMSMSLSSLKGQGMPDLGSNLDPKVQSKIFDKALVSFTQAGSPETIDGVEAVPYEITIDPKKAPEAYGGLVTDVLTFTYFMGPDNLPRKMVYKDPKGNFTATYTDWGVPVDIKAPPADKLMQIPSGATP